MSKITNQLNQLSTFASHHTDSRASWLLSTFRPLTLGLFLTFSLFTFQSCGLDIEDPTPPSPPVWVQKSLPEEWPERGIDAHESSGIYLEWEPNPDEDILAYNIYRATWYDVDDSLGEYDLLTRLEPESSHLLEYVDRDVESRTRYYFKLKAIDLTNNLSHFSDSLDYLLLPGLEALYLFPNGTSDTLGIERTLSWRYGYHNEMEDYCFTLLTEESEFITRVIMSPGNYVGDREIWQIPTDISLLFGQVYKWRIDTNARYISGFETAGSESKWATFVYGGD